MDEKDRLPAFLFVIFSFGLIGLILFILVIAEIANNLFI